MVEAIADPVTPRVWARDRRPSSERSLGLVLVKFRGTELEILDHPLFKDADQTLIEPILVRVRPRHYARAELIAAPGTSTGLLLVLAGQLRNYVLTADGRRVVFDLIGPGGFDGIQHAVGLPGHFTEAAVPTRVAQLPGDVVDRLVRADPTIALNLVAIVSRRLAAREQQLETMALRDPARRIAARLLALARVAGENGGDRVRLPHRVTHQTLAEMSGIRRETVTLHLQRLAAVGAVHHTGEQLEVSPAALLGVVGGTVRPQ